MYLHVSAQSNTSCDLLEERDGEMINYHTSSFINDLNKSTM